jgi:hypothetical protein
MLRDINGKKPKLRSKSKWKEDARSSRLSVKSSDVSNAASITRREIREELRERHSKSSVELSVNNAKSKEDSRRRLRRLLRVKLLVKMTKIPKMRSKRVRLMLNRIPRQCKTKPLWVMKKMELLSKSLKEIKALKSTKKTANPARKKRKRLASQESPRRLGKSLSTRKRRLQLPLLNKKKPLLMNQIKLSLMKEHL